MFKLLIGAAIGFAAAWFMDSKEGESRRAMIKEKAGSIAGKGKEQAQQAVEQVKEKSSNGGGVPGRESYEAATSGEPIEGAESDPATAPGPETFKAES